MWRGEGTIIELLTMYREVRKKDARMFRSRTVRRKKKPNPIQPNLTETNFFSYGELSYEYLQIGICRLQILARAFAACCCEATLYASQLKQQNIIIKVG